MKKLFPLMILVAALQAVSAWSAIVYFSGPSFYLPVNSDPVSLDINQDATADVSFSGEWLATDDFPSSESSIICYVSGANGAQLLVTNGYAQILSSGESIGSDSPDWNAGNMLLTTISFNNLNNTSSGWLGPLGTAGQGCLGIQFSAADGIHYGWIQVCLTNTSEGLPLSPMVLDWAYENTPNTLINAGQTSDDISFTANFSGANEVPPNKSTHSGSGSFVLESYVDGYILSYHLELDDAFQPTSAGIFGPATPTMNARFLIANLGAYSISNFPPPILTPLDLYSHQPSPVVPPFPGVLIYDGQITLNSNQVAELLAGQLYVNFKSAKFRQGELRGEIWPTAPIRFSAILTGRIENPRNHRNTIALRGEAAFTLTGSQLNCELALDTNFSWNSIGIYGSPIPRSQTLVASLTNSFGVMIPEGGFPGHPGLPGQVLYPEQATLTDKQVSQLKSGGLYLNILTSRPPRGVMSGRISPDE
jgi:hypothetical protein